MHAQLYREPYLLCQSQAEIWTNLPYLALQMLRSEALPLDYIELVELSRNQLLHAKTIIKICKQTHLHYLPLLMQEFE